MKFSLRRGFTLVEMLIVIVIIGLLASSLIPKLTGMQAKARDTVRKADLNQLGTAIQVYYVDNGAYPETRGSVDIHKGILSQYLTTIPQDPQKTKTFAGIVGSGTAGQYMYSPIVRNGISNAAFVLMAGTEEPGSATNWVYSAGDGGSSDVDLDGNGGGNGEISEVTEFLTLQEHICVSVKRTTTDGTNAVNGTGDDTCQAKPKEDNLRYLYIQ